MGALIQAGQLLVAGTGPGQLNQYYGFADANQTVFTAATFGNVSTPYVIPAGEADYADVSYQLDCGGYGVQGSTQQQLYFSMYAGSQLGSQPWVAAATLSVSQAFRWWMRMILTCSDGSDSWWGTLEGGVVESGQATNPGTAGQQACAMADANTAVHLVSTSSAITCAIQAKWNATTGAPTMTNVRTRWAKIA
jgi:hypothetical protein